MIRKQYTFGSDRYYTYETKDFDKIKSINELCDLLLGVFKIRDILYMQQIEIAKDICKAVRKQHKTTDKTCRTQYIKKGGK